MSLPSGTRRVRRSGSTTAPAGWTPALPSGVSALYVPQVRGGVSGYLCRFTGTLGSTGALFIDFGQASAVNTDIMRARLWAQVSTDDAAITELQLACVERGAGGFLAGTYNSFYSTRTTFAERSADRTNNNASTNRNTLEWLTNSITSGTTIFFSIWLANPVLLNMG